MEVREIHVELTRPLQNLLPEGNAGGNLDAVRAAGEALFNAADKAIEDALAGDSRAFLEATRQEGGQ